MSLVILVSALDPVGLRAKEKLLDHYHFYEVEASFDGNPVYERDGVLLATSRFELLHSSHVEAFFKPSLAIFISKHKAKLGVPSLLVHAPGNWGSGTSFGGKPWGICHSFASAIKEALIELNRQRSRLGLEHWRCGLEATHHGPYLEETAALFIEVGSTEREWHDDVAIEAVVAATMKACRARPNGYRVASGFGGGHYAPKFTKLSLDTDYAFAHIIPKYAFKQGLKEEMIIQAVTRSLEKVEYALIDAKGLPRKDKSLTLKVLAKTEVKVLEV